MAAAVDKSCSVIATHIPADVNRREIQEYFSEVGPVKKCHLVRDKNDTFKGMAYIIYAVKEDASEAVKRLDNTSLHGKTVRVKFSHQRKTKQEAEEELDFGRKNTVEDGEKKKKRDTKKPRKGYKKKELGKQRNGRVIIRNLSFKANEQIVEEHFSKYGKISEVSILRKKDGKMVGCAFVQFNTKAEALKAIQECNMKPLIGRPVAVDLAVAKERFLPSEAKKETTKDEDDVTEIKVKEEVLSNDEEENVEEAKIKEEKVSSDYEDGDSGLDDGEDDGEIDEGHGEHSTLPKASFPTTKGPSNDILEQRTLFIKNLPFSTTEEEIAEVLKKFGELRYVLLCIDQLTEQPRGTAFAQFKEREAADACLAAEANLSTKNEFVIHGQPMHVMRAVSRMELEKRKTEKAQEKATKDNRNLYLAREGFVRQGTQAALGVSNTDMALRIKREQVKRRMLQNFHIFVSTTRLCINNLPERINDRQLHAIFRKHSPEGAKITEARIMRDLKNIEENGKPKSRGYGFVTFTEHEHALAALRKINNNPDIFTNDHRPVVEFSLENRSVLNARKKRAEKSREKNPLWKKDGRGTTQGSSKKDIKNPPQIKKLVEKSEHLGESHSSFMGSKSNPSNRALPTNYGPKIRHNERNSAGKGKISRKQFRKEQRDRALGRKRKRPVNEDHGDSLPAKKPFLEETESKGKKKKKKNTKKISKQMKDEKAFDSMVQKYKQKMSSVSSSNEKKWFED